MSKKDANVQSGMGVVKARLIGNAPYVSNKFTMTDREAMRNKMLAGDHQLKDKRRDPKDFDKLYEESIHRLRDGNAGMPSIGLRKALIRAAKVAGFHMTDARTAVFVLHDGFDPDDGTPLLKFKKGKPTMVMHNVELRNGVTDLKARGMWTEGWEVEVTLKFDFNQISPENAMKMLVIAGEQVGVGAGRPFSKRSEGMGWGTFVVEPMK